MAQKQEEDVSRLLFPSKLLHILDNAERIGESHIVAWTSNGKAFKVHNKHAFEAHIMPRYFNSNKYRAFHRTLNLWGFAAVNTGPLQGCIWHPLFQRGRLDLFQRIHRVERAVRSKGRPSGRNYPEKQPASLKRGDATDDAEGNGQYHDGDDDDDDSLDPQGADTASSDQGQHPAHSVASSLGGRNFDLEAAAVPSRLTAVLASINTPGVHTSQGNLESLQRQLAQRQLCNILGGAPGGPFLHAMSNVNHTGMNQQTPASNNPALASLLEQLTVNPGTAQQQLNVDQFLQQRLNPSHANTLRPHQGFATPPDLGCILPEQLMNSNYSMPQRNALLLRMFAQQQQLLLQQQETGQSLTSRAAHLARLSHGAHKSDIDEFEGVSIEGQQGIPTGHIHRLYEQFVNQKGGNDSGAVALERPSKPSSGLDQGQSDGATKTSASQQLQNHQSNLRLQQLLQTPSIQASHRNDEAQQSTHQLLLQILGHQSRISQSDVSPTYHDSLLSPPLTDPNFIRSVPQPTGASATDQLLAQLLGARQSGLDSGSLSSHAPWNVASVLAASHLQSQLQQQDATSNSAAQLALLQTLGVSGDGPNHSLIRSLLQTPAVSVPSISSLPTSTNNQARGSLQVGDLERPEVSNAQLMMLLQTFQNPAQQSEGGSEGR